MNVIDRSELAQENARLRGRVEELEAELANIRDLLRGSSEKLAVALGLSRTQGRIMAMLMSGRTYHGYQLAEACLTGDVASNAVYVHICNIRRKLPWVQILSRKGSDVGFTLAPASVERIKALAG